MGLYFQNYMVYIEFHNLQVLIENLPIWAYTGPIYIHVHVQYYMCGCSNVSSMKKNVQNKWISTVMHILIMSDLTWTFLFNFSVGTETEEGRMLGISFGISKSEFDTGK